MITSDEKIQYETYYFYIQGHSSLTPIYLYSHRMNFGALGVKNSYPQLEVNCDVECRSLNYAVSYDVQMAHSVMSQ